MGCGRLRALVFAPLVIGLLGACAAGDEPDPGDDGSSQSIDAGDGNASSGTQEPQAPDEDTGTQDEDPEENVQLSAESASPRPGVAAEVAPGEVQVDEPADELVAPVITEQSRALESPAQVDWDSVVSVADGDLLSAIEVAILEYTELGWSQIGVPELVSSTVLEFDEDAATPTARVEVCLDHDQVDVVDSDGVSMIDDTAETRVKSILTLSWIDERWVALSQDFTDELSC